MDQCDILHHLLGIILSIKVGELLPLAFCSLAIATHHRCVLVVARGSISVIHTFLVDYFNTNTSDPFPSRGARLLPSCFSLVMPFFGSTLVIRS